MTNKKHENTQVSVLFVCMGNICRSPTAEGVFRKHVIDARLEEKIFIDSAGTHAFHEGEPADRRSSQVAERRGYSLTGITARRVSADDFTHFDFILAMDSANLTRLLEQAGDEHRTKVKLFLEFGAEGPADVPDPYYGGSAGFEHVLDLVEDAARGLLHELQRKLNDDKAP